MISKELLSEVLEREVTDFEYWDNNEYRCTAYFDGFRQRFFLNIYELAHKCKEWAFYTYKISVSSFKSGSFYLKEFNQIKDNSEYWVELDTASIDCEINIDDSGIFKSCSEHEAIFKACQWILDNKGIK